ncbi:hypothetical protein VIAQ111709_18250 [Vibrio aquimaris]|uniref:Uncharacterized protein n=2 Tax=Vibrio aquimaris TaxID=2587862 RepID=A0A5P9CQA6_9VIBR|nr:hypothetical protein FIV01_16535 [Vibrio aquimaris]
MGSQADRKTRLPVIKNVRAAYLNKTDNLMKTLLGWSTVTSAERNGVKRDALFKRLAIYFEYIVFNNQLTPVGLPLPGVGKLSQTEFLSYIVAKDKYEAVRLQKNKKFTSIFLDCWDFVEDERDFELGLSSAISEQMKGRILHYAHKKEMKEGEFIHNLAFKQLCGDMWHELQLYSSFKKYDPNIAGNLSIDLGKVFSDYSKNEGILVEDISGNSQYIPDFGDFTWEQIIELRSDPFIKSFRTKMHSSFRSKDNDPVDALDQLAIDGLWSVAEYAKPNLGKTLLNAILSNVPTPIPVYGIMSALKDGANKIDLAHDNGWLFFIQGARGIHSKKP